MNVLNLYLFISSLNRRGIPGTVQKWTLDCLITLFYIAKITVFTSNLVGACSSWSTRWVHQRHRMLQDNRTEPQNILWHDEGPWPGTLYSSNTWIRRYVQQPMGSSAFIYRIAIEWCCSSCLGNTQCYECFESKEHVWRHAHHLHNWQWGPDECRHVILCAFNYILPNTFDITRSGFA